LIIDIIIFGIWKNPENVKCAFLFFFPYGLLIHGLPRFVICLVTGETIISPGSKQGLIPLVIPLSENLSG
jgi:hypothetical protein